MIQAGEVLECATILTIRASLTIAGIDSELEIDGMAEDVLKAWREIDFFGDDEEDLPMDALET